MDLNEESDVGIGVVYEQFRLNKMLRRIIKKYTVKNVLESPIYGMAGLTGINSMALSDIGVVVTLADQKVHIDTAKKAWQKANRKANFIELSDHLPFEDNEFDLSYNFAALWHLKEPEKIIEEICRTSQIVLICMPNPWNPLFQVRKFFGVLPKNHHWTDRKSVEQELVKNGFEVAETGVFDIPPWPDVVVSLKSLFGIKKTKKWRWSMLDYYMGAIETEKKISKYYFLEDSKLPELLKLIWAHHSYIIAIKN